MWRAKPGKHIVFPSKGIHGLKLDTTLDYQMIGWNGRCEVHEKFTVQDIRNVREQFPDVVHSGSPRVQS